MYMRICFFIGIVFFCSLRMMGQVEGIVIHPDHSVTFTFKASHARIVQIAGLCLPSVIGLKLLSVLSRKNQRRK